MRDQEPIESTEETGTPDHVGGRSKRRHRAGHRHSEGKATGPQVIARIPRVPRNEESPPSAGSTGDRLGRLVGSRLSAWVLVGGVVLLVVAALSPFLVSRAFRSKSDADSDRQATAQRPDVPAPDAPTASRWSGASAAVDSRRTGAGPSGPFLGNDYRTGLPVAARANADSPAFDESARWNRQASSNAAASPAGAVPWQASPGSRRGNSISDPAADGPSAIQGESGTVYRAPRVGGLVNAMSPNARDTSAAEPPPEYRTATRPRYAEDPRSSMLNDRRISYPETTPSNPYSSPGATGVEVPRDGGQLPSYRNSLPPPGYPSRGPSTSYDSAYPARGTMSGYEPGSPTRGAASGYDSGYPSRAAASGYESAYPTRGPSTGFDSAQASSRRPATGTWSGNPAGVSPGWASPQASSEGSPSGYPATAVPSYPATGYSGPESGPRANYALGAGGETAAQSADYEAAQLEGTIEKPTARTSSYDPTRPSIR